MRTGIRLSSALHPRRLALAAGAVALAASGASAQYYQRYFNTSPDAAIFPESIIERSFTAVGGHAVAGQWRRGLGYQCLTLHEPGGGLFRARAWAQPGNFDEGATDVVTEPSLGDFVVVGFTQNFLAGAASLDLTLTRLDPGASVIWSAVYTGSADFPDEASRLDRYQADIEVVRDVRPGGLPEGFVVATTFRAGPQIADRGQFLRTNTAGGLLVHRLYLPAAQIETGDLSFTDIEFDASTDTFVVTGTLLDRSIDPTGLTIESRWPIFVRLDAAGNVLVARRIFIAPLDPNLPFESTGLGLEIAPGGDVVITGATNYFSTSRGAFVTRLDPAGNPIWVRAFRQFEPGVRSIDIDTTNAAGSISVAGSDASTNVPAPGLLTLDPAGNPVFRRIFFPPPPTPGPFFAGLDAIRNLDPSFGWSILAVKEVLPGTRSIHLLRADPSGRTGCFERRIDPLVAQPPIDIADFVLIEQFDQLNVFRPVEQFIPPLDPEIICLGDCSCPGDGDKNGAVNFADITSVLTNFGANYLPGSGPGDADCNGIVNFADITAVLTNFGLNCP